MNGGTKTETSAIDEGGAKGAQDSENRQSGLLGCTKCGVWHFDGMGVCVTKII